jgi:hypothetical protein
MGVQGATVSGIVLAAPLLQVDTPLVPRPR